MREQTKLVPCAYCKYYYNITKSYCTYFDMPISVLLNSKHNDELFQCGVFEMS